MYEYSAGLGIDVPSLKITSSFKGGQNWLVKEKGTDAKKVYGNGSVYYRPDFLAKLQATLFVRGQINDYSYSPENDGSRDFREDSVTVGLNMQY